MGGHENGKQKPRNSYLLPVLGVPSPAGRPFSKTCALGTKGAISMKFEATIFSQEDCGDEAKITLGNIRKVNSAFWRDYCPNMEIFVPHSKLKNYRVTRKVIIEIKLRKVGK
jgi:hypothetical protein